MKHQALITKIEQESPDTRTIHFTVKKGILDFKAGHYISVYMPEKYSGQCKAYSLSSAPFDDNMSITVKNIGEFSNYICSKEVNDNLIISSPYGFFAVENDLPIIGIAGGVGVSPIWSIIRDRLNLNPNANIRLLTSAKKPETLIFLTKIKETISKYSNFRGDLFTTQDKSTNPDFNNRRISISTDLSKDELNNSQFYLCGSEDFVRSMWRQLNEKGVDPTRISTETFFNDNPW